MIIKTLSLEPFGGFLEQKITFKPGLNVILGPNDVGKSTVFRAIDSVLFLQTKLKSNTIEGRELKRIIPLGGDHAKVTIDFESKNRSFSLEKVWGQNSNCTLSLPDGHVLTIPEKIEEEIRQIIPVPPATFKSVLLAKQNSLEKTVQELEENQESLHSLGDILRLAVNQTDGVSVDQLKTLLAKKMDETFLNWDNVLNSPKKSRGIENPWDRQGRILKSYYEKERLRKRLIETQALEIEFGDRIRLLNEKLLRQNVVKDFIQKNEKIVEAVSLRQNLQLKLAQAEQEASSLIKDLNTWIQFDADRKMLEPEIARLETLIQTLNLELKESREELARKTLLARFEKIETAKKNLDELRKTFSALPVVKPEHINQLRQRWSSIEKLKASLSAGKLQISFIPKVEMEVTFRRDLEKEKKEVLLKMRPLELIAGGKIQISNNYFDLIVKSGDGNIDQIESLLKKESELLRELLSTLGVKSMEEAQDKSEKWVNMGQLVRSAEATLGTLLGSETYEQVQKQIQSLPQVKALRSFEIIEKEFGTANRDLAIKKANLSTGLRLTQEIQNRYQINESLQLTSIMIKKGVEQETLKGQIASLPPLPDGICDIDAYLNEFKTCRSELPQLLEEIRTLSNLITELKARMPEQSAQDFDRQYREAMLAFDRENRRGQALMRVSQALQVIDTQDGDFYRDFRMYFENSLARMSAGKYNRTEMKESLPTEFYRKDGVKIPYSWLSTGTKDGFSLSLRLAMAKYFLEQADGFILMDDPLVAMDPERQKISAELLTDFSQQAQIVVFTCHPEHAKLLGGNRIELNA